MKESSSVESQVPQPEKRSALDIMVEASVRKVQEGELAKQKRRNELLEQKAMGLQKRVEELGEENARLREENMCLREGAPPVSVSRETVGVLERQRGQEFQSIPVETQRASTEKKSEKELRNELSDRFYTWKIEGKPVEVVIDRKILQKIWEHCYDDTFVPPSGIEAGGVLFGETILEEGIYKVSIYAAEPVVYEQATHVHFVFEGKQKRKLVNLQRAKYPRLEQVGWYHSHLNDPVFLSPPDRDFQKMTYNQPWHVALVVQARENKAGFFIWENGDIQWHRSYHEFFLQNESRPR